MASPSDRWEEVERNVYQLRHYTSEQIEQMNRRPTELINAALRRSTEPLSGNAMSEQETEGALERSFQSMKVGRCGCWRCLGERREMRLRMILCPQCGNKRCPKASDHDLACTGSNEPAQLGSVYR